MRIVVRSASDVRDHYADVLEDARFNDTATVIERHGRRVAIVVGLDWYEAHRGADDPTAYPEAEAPAEADPACHCTGAEAPECHEVCPMAGHVGALCEQCAGPGLPGDDLPE